MSVAPAASIRFRASAFLCAHKPRTSRRLAPACLSPSDTPLSPAHELPLMLCSCSNYRNTDHSTLICSIPEFTPIYIFARDSIRMKMGDRTGVLMPISREAGSFSQ